MGCGVMMQRQGMHRVQGCGALAFMGSSGQGKAASMTRHGSPSRWGKINTPINISNMISKFKE